MISVSRSRGKSRLTLVPEIIQICDYFRFRANRRKQEVFGFATIKIET